MEYKCDHCKEWKDEEEFNWKFKSLGVRHKTCRECKHGFDKKYFEGPAKERHLQQVNKEKTPPVKLQGSLHTTTSSPIPVKNVEKVMSVSLNFITKVHLRRIWL